MKRFNIGLIGYGMAGAVFHAPLIRSVAGLDLAAVVTSRSEQVSAALPGVRVVPGTPALLADPTIDCVVVATPTATHFEMARAALLAGKHVVVDKPLAVTVTEADELIALAERLELRVSAFQNRRWDSDYLTVRHCIAQGWLGEVLYFDSHFDRFRPQLKQGWRERPGPGSGILYDLGAHLIDQALHLFGMPDAVTADILRQRTNAEVDDYFHLMLDYGRLRVILHSATLVAASGLKFSVHGDRGSFQKYGMDPQEQALKEGMRPGHPQWGLESPGNYGTLTHGDGSTQIVESLAGGYQHFYEGWAACLAGEGPLPVDPRDARNGLVVIEAAQKSATLRKTVSISDDAAEPPPLR